MIKDVQDLLTHLTSMEAAAERRFPVSAESVKLRTDQLRTMVGLGASLADIRERARELHTAPFMGSGAGMKWLDSTWTRLIEALPLPVDSAEVAAHITESLMGPIDKQAILATRIDSLMNSGATR